MLPPVMLLLADITPVTYSPVVANTATDALRITQTGAGNALVVEDSANPDATPFVIDASGVVIVGSTAKQPNVPLGDGALYGAQTQMFGSSYGTAGIAATLYNAAAAGGGGQLPVRQHFAGPVLHLQGPLRPHPRVALGRPGPDRHDGAGAGGPPAGRLLLPPRHSPRVPRTLAGAGADRLPGTAGKRRACPPGPRSE